MIHNVKTQLLALVRVSGAVAVADAPVIFQPQRLLLKCVMDDVKGDLNYPWRCKRGLIKMTNQRQMLRNGIFFAVCQ